MNHMDLKFSATLQNEVFARTAVASFVASINPNLEELSDIKTIVAEAVSNAIIHGYRLDANRDVYVKVNIVKRNVEIIIQDYGIGIENVDLAMQDNYSSKKEEGRLGMGMTIMKSLSDHLSIHSVFGLGTKVIIQKSLSEVIVEVR